MRDALALVQAAREGARAAAVTGRDADAVDAIRRSAGPLDADAIEIAISPDEGSRDRGAPVTVDLRYAARLRVPIVSRVMSFELPLRASSTMRIERDVQTPVPSPP